MDTIAIYGAGGFGRETRMLLEAINRSYRAFSFAGFVDDNPEVKALLAPPGSFAALALAVASPSARRSMHERTREQYAFPRLIHPDVWIDPSVSVGQGAIVCSGAKITVDCTIGDFVILNLNATIGHDVSIGAFSSIMPSANISGGVVLEEGVFVGTGASILQGLVIGEGAVIGAGAVVTRNVPPGVVAKGVPARWK